MEDEELKLEILKHEKEQILLEQIELSTIMVNPIPLKKLWIHNAIQFGFIAFFVLSFPAAAIIGLIINLFHINFLYFSFTDHLKRRPSVERGNIGIWNSIFLFMSFIALVINIAILVFSSEGLVELLQQGNNSFDLSRENVILVLVIAEHIVFLIKFILTLIINDKPQWVSSYLYEQNFKKQIDEENTKKKMLAKLKKIKQDKRKKKLKEKLSDKLSKTIEEDEGELKPSGWFGRNTEKEGLKKDDE